MRLPARNRLLHPVQDQVLSTWLEAGFGGFGAEAAAKHELGLQRNRLLLVRRLAGHHLLEKFIGLVCNLGKRLQDMRHGRLVEDIDDENGIGKGRYYVFMADTGSASCAEIMLTGVLHNTKSPLVGMVTYGKGIGQAYLGTYAGGLAGITCLRIFDKYGKSYHRYGFAPDYEESDPEKALELALSLAKEATAVGAGNYGTTDLGHFTLKKSVRASKKPERGGAFKVIRDPIAKPAVLK